VTVTTQAYVEKKPQNKKHTKPVLIFTVLRQTYKHDLYITDAIQLA